jgi:hypothetical protein
MTVRWGLLSTARGIELRRRTDAVAQATVIETLYDAAERGVRA